MILPQPGPGFEWFDTPRGPALACRPLAAIAPHLFTTRSWALGRAPGAGDPAWAEVADALGVSPPRLARLHQVHGNASVVAGAVDAGRSSDVPQADIVVGRYPDTVVAVQAADCVPILIADERRGVVAAAHAGWRGLALGVPAAAVSALGEAFESRAEDLVVALGPSIGACCYEVGPEVRQAFADAGFDGEALGRWFREGPASLPQNPSMPRVSGAGRQDRLYFDGWAAVRDQLCAAGVPEGRIFSAGLCTASHPDALCSYRREGSAAGRMAAAIRPSPRP